MTRLEITHIDKPDRYSPVEAIRELMGPTWGPSTLASCVAWAEIPGNSFFVRGLLGAAVEVRVMPPKTLGGNKYLQTVADKTTENNLLSLPPIPAARRVQS